MRFPVATVVAMLGDGMTNEEILVEHSDLELADLTESHNYAAPAAPSAE
jgi:uncharacterized protein (DUF433 family)